MARKSRPRAGSLAYYPRKRAKSIIPKYNSFKEEKELKILNFYGYKVGMLHLIATNKHKGSPLVNQKVRIPATVVEVPSMTIFGIRFYAKKDLGIEAKKDFIFYNKADKELSRLIKSATRVKVKGDLLKKANDFFEKNKDEIVDIRLIAHTNPKLTTIGKKKPEVVELFASGSNEDKFNLYKEKIGLNLDAKDIFKENSFLDAKAVTKGYGFEGVIKRHGVKRRHHKSEKGVRKVGSIGPWHPPLVMWTVPRPGQRGFHSRVDYNLKLLKIAKSDEVNKASGWKRYGLVKNDAIIIAGSIPGPVKRTIVLREGMRPVKDIKNDVDINKIVLVNKS